MTTHDVDPRPPRVERRDVLLWLGVLAGPLAWAAQLQINYALAPTACALGGKTFLHLVSLVAFLVAVAGAFVGWLWRRKLPEGSTEFGDAEASRARFMALSGMILGLFFALVIVALEIPNWTLRVCD
ncbi:MAG TPA: hypothetical protein VF789_01765 [Thermoanaerobaculia bacterium]